MSDYDDDFEKSSPTKDIGIGGGKYLSKTHWSTSIKLLAHLIL